MEVSGDGGMGDGLNGLDGLDGLHGLLGGVVFWGEGRRTRAISKIVFQTGRDLRQGWGR